MSGNVNSTWAEQASTPSTPGTDKWKIYPKADGKWYALDDAAVEHELAFAASILPSSIPFITQTPSGSLSAEQALSLLATGLVKVNTTTGVLESVNTSADLAGLISDETGSGALVFGTGPTLSAPTISDFTNMQHDHLDADDGGTLSASAIASGTLALARGGLGSDLSATGPGFLEQATNSAVVTVIKCNYSASAAPTVNDDSGDGYAVRSIWYDLTNDTIYDLLDATVGAAVWVERAGGGGGATDFTDLGDVPASYSGQANKVVSVKADESGLEFSTPSAGASDEIAFPFPNASFETWENGTSSAPDNWAVTGSGATIAREGTTKKHGSYSAALTRVGNDCSLTRNLYDLAGGTYVRGRQVTFGAYVYATVASRARLRIYDGIGTTNSSYHTGGSGWELLTVTRTLDGSATELTIGLEVNSGNTTAYIDAMTLVAGATLTQYQPQSMLFNQFPRRWTGWFGDSLITAGNPLTTSIDTGQAHNVVYLTTSAAVNDAWTQSFFLADGSYTLSFLGRSGTDQGIMTVYIDDVSQGTIDWYNGSTVKNVVKTISITVIGNGYHVLKVVMATKNGSSSNYYWYGTKMSIYPSAD